MKRYSKSLAAMVLLGLIVSCGPDTSSGNEGKNNGAAPTSDTSYFYGARIIPGDGSPVLEDMSFITKAGKITAIAPRKELAPPKGSNRVELTGRTVAPAFLNVQAQPGMSNGAQYGPKNYNRDSLTADLSRYEYYGVVAVLTAGTDAGGLAASVRTEISEGKSGARLLTAGRGIAAKGGGPAALSEVTIQVANAADAKKAVADLVDQKVDSVKLWMEDGNGKGPRLKSDAFSAVIDEAHKRKLKVVAQVFSLSDAKELAQAGIDGFVSSIRDREVDDALISTMKSKNIFLAPALTAAEAKFVYADSPKWLGEQTMREVYPARLMGYLNDPVIINRFKRNSEIGDLRQQYATAIKNLKKLYDGGVKIALGTNSGVADTYPGYFELREMIAMADAGMKPMDVIKAATSVPAEILGQTDLGTIAVGKTGDFVAMPENPLDKMTAIKDVGLLFINGSEQERSALIQSIQTNDAVPTITKEDRARDAEAERLAEIKKQEEKLPHYGPFVLGQSVFVRSMSLPVPKGGKAEPKSGPPDRITVSMRASAAELRAFYKDALAKYNWKVAGNCWELEHPRSKKTETLCLEASNNSAVIQITEK
jgi:imidazolonepropionase-like amidohydrolase